MVVKSYNPQQLGQLEGAWRQLEAGKDMTAFQTYDWYKLVNETYLNNSLIKSVFIPRYFVLFCDDTPIAIAPVMLQRFSLGNIESGYPKGIYFLGRSTPTDYFSFIYKELNQEQLIFILKSIKEYYKNNRFFFNRVRENTVFSDLLEEFYQCKIKKSACAAIDLDRSFDEYYQSLSKKAKQNYRTVINRLKRDNLDLEFFCSTTITPELSSRLEELYIMRQAFVKQSEKKSMSIKGRLYNWASSFFTKNIPVMSSYPNPWIYLVKDVATQKIIAFFYGIYEKENHCARMLFTGMEEQYSRYSPITAGLIQFLKEEYQTKQRMPLKTLDFTRGGERYKYTLGGVDSYVDLIMFVAPDEQ